jgi:excisionase family DNA binding protein
MAPVAAPSEGAWRNIGHYGLSWKATTWYNGLGDATEEAAKMTEFLTIDEAARYLKISRTTVYRFVRQGLLVPYRLGERVVRFRKDDLDAALKPDRPKEETR